MAKTGTRITYEIRTSFNFRYCHTYIITGLGCSAHGATDVRSVITVQYVTPRKFYDSSIHDRDIRYSASVFTEEITEDLASVINRRFPGHRLTLRFTNIDLAGNGTTEPRSVRVVQTNRPARLSFEYLLQDQSGLSVAGGSQTFINTPRLGHAAHAVSSGHLPLERRVSEKHPVIDTFPDDSPGLSRRQQQSNSRVCMRGISP